MTNKLRLYLLLFPDSRCWNCKKHRGKENKNAWSTYKWCTEYDWGSDVEKIKFKKDKRITYEQVCEHYDK